MDDIRQELLVDLIARFPGFDRDRGSLGAFANTVLGHRMAELAHKLRRESRLYGTRPVSLDEPLPDGDGETLGDNVAEGDGLAALYGQSVVAFSAIEQRIDLERSAMAIGTGDRVLWAGLRHHTVEELSASGKTSRSSLYRRVKDIRLVLTAFGLRPA